jgi:hypothetical protein
MDSTTNLSVEEQVKLFAAMPLPRRVRPVRTMSKKIIFPLLIALFLLAIWQGVHGSYSDNPRDFFTLGLIILLIAMRFGITWFGWADPVSRKLLMNGTPAAGRVLSNERRLSGQWITFSYEVAPKTVMEGRIVAHRRRDLQIGTPVVVFYDPEVPDHSIILGCKDWDLDVPHPTS